MKFSKGKWRETFSLADAHYRDARGIPVPDREIVPEATPPNPDREHIKKAIWHLQKYLEKLQ